MKKIFIPCMMLITMAVSAQDFRIGLKGIFNSTWLFNNNIADQRELVNYAATFGTSIGLTSQFYFNDNFGVSLDVLYASNGQRLEGDLGPEDSYESRTNVKYIDIPVLLRITSEGGAYVEFGPQVSFLAGAKEDFTSSPSVLGDDYSDRDVKHYFNSTGIAPVLGFGVDIEASDSWLVNIGLRFGYGIMDATVQLSEEEVDNDLVNDKGSWFGRLAHFNAQDPPEYNYQKTNRAFGGFTLGVIYRP